MTRPGTRFLVAATPTLWSLGLALVILGPALGPGYLLLRDMVWVPDLTWGRADVMGVGSGLPRAVPSDAVVALLDNVIPAHGVALMALVGALVLAGSGAAALVEGSLPGRIVAASAAVWSPFVVERLGMGHWPVLLGYGAVPWLAVAGRRIASGERWPVWLIPMLALGSLSANAGLVSALVLVATSGVVRRPATPRSRFLLLAVVVVVNAPWIIAGLSHAGIGSDPAGFEVFRPAADGVPAWLAVLSGAGIWNVEVVLDSRMGPQAWAALAVIAVAVLVAGRRWWRSMPQAPIHAGLAACAITLAWAALLFPDAIAATVGRLPGGGLLRDATRSEALLLPAFAGVAGSATQRVLDWLAEHGVASFGRAVLAGGMVLVPVGLMPDAAGGLSGQLRPVSYPAVWSQVRAAVSPGDGDALVLPLSNFRAPWWNDNRAVIDPWGRFLRVTTVIGDDLVVDGATVAGEDPRVDDVRSALREPTADARANALRRLGFGWVIADAAGADPTAFSSLPPIAGRLRTFVDGAGVSVVVIALPEG